MMERGELMAVLAILLLCLWIDGSLAAPVPSLFHGSWEGSAVSAARSHRVRIGIVSGANKDTVAFVHAQRSSPRSLCVHHLQLTAQSDKKGRKDRGVFEGKTISHFLSTDQRNCYNGIFRFEPLNIDRIFVEWKELNADGDYFDKYEMIMDRMDDGKLRQTLDRCNSRASPAGRLRNRATCKEEAPELPSRFFGLWGGLGVTDSGGKIGITAIITGGSINSTVAMVYTTNFAGKRYVDACGHRMILSEGGGEQNKEDAYEIETQARFLWIDDCYLAKVRLTSIQSNKNKILVDWKRLDGSTRKVAKEFPPIALDRYDSGRLTKTIDKCKPSKGDLLRTQLFCDRKNKKGKKKVKGGARG